MNRLNANGDRKSLILMDFNPFLINLKPAGRRIQAVNFERPFVRSQEVLESFEATVR